MSAADRKAEMTKYIQIALVVAVLIGGGAYYYLSRPKAETPEPSHTGTIVAVTAGSVCGLGAIGAAVYFLCQDPTCTQYEKDVPCGNPGLSQEDQAKFIFANANNKCKNDGDESNKDGCQMRCCSTSVGDPYVEGECRTWATTEGNTCPKGSYYVLAAEKTKIPDGASATSTCCSTDGGLVREDNKVA